MANNVVKGFPNAGHFYSNIVGPVKIDLNFVVDSANGNGLGIRSLKSNGAVKSVYMHTSATPAVGSPNPASGLAVIQFSNNFNKYLGGFSGFVSPLSGTNVAVGASALTVGQAYVITVLGTSTAADWLAAGVPAGLVPAVGLSFIALATGAGSGSGQVQLATVSGVNSLEVVGDANQSIANSSVSQNGGAILIVKFLANNALAAPANGSVVGMSVFFDNSSVSVDGL